MQQAQDFLEESEVLAEAVAELADADWARPTQFKGWTIEDVFVHLHFWNRAADLSLFDPDAFETLMARVMPGLPAKGFRSVENAEIPERGAALRDAWLDQARAMAARWHDIDPSRRVQWVGPGMSVRSSITARQMETWAHGHEVFDCLGRIRRDGDRIRNIVVLGVNTFGWSFRVHGHDVPAQVPRLRLIAPSGAVWDYGDADSPDLIEGPAVGFAQVVTQTRNVADTDLRVTGDTATRWMEQAQCFAGGPETPPPAGTRFQSATPGGSG